MAQIAAARTRAAPPEPGVRRVIARSCMIVFPEPPELPASQTTTAETRFRYEDISQEGRIKVTGLPHALGVSVWQNLLAGHPMQRAAFRAGMAPILSRMV